MLKRISIGFDLRSLAASISPSGLSARRWLDDQLLSNSFEVLISADPNVFPRREDIDRLMYEDAEQICNPLGLARCIEWLVDKCQISNLSLNEQIGICITCSEGNVVGLTERFGPEYFEGLATEDQLLKQDWEFRGFDVIDILGLISGLSGCGYKASSKSELKRLFAADLNNVGLFCSYSLAQQFAEVRGIQILEHSPMIAVGILTRK